ncbi:magnesium-translocating P-type ATPase [Cloacibacillus sp.]|uniref:magnesium-translocating P-type ATPase n=1 Tax=Cloacibacillus sp. TaxID=2049023 RepID=UPI0025B83A10|nr:magnesium-translocating P-type ATPase [Cloacibacillus sp.]MCC8059019.1 magnesium-translocating P-type ATPase [Cloacibacillus sp.]
MPKKMLSDSRMKRYAGCGAEEIFRAIPTTPAGLPQERVEAMRAKYGENRLSSRKNDTFPHRLRRAFVDPFTMILFTLAVISLVTDVLLASNFTRNITTSLIICVMILVSGAIRLVQETRAKRASDRLDRLIHANVTVKRGGILVDIPAERLVVGDLVMLSAGGRIPADLRLIKTMDLFVSQAAITGESAILEKDSAPCIDAERTPFTRLKNLAFMASSVISGRGEGVVIAVGRETLYGNFVRPDSKNSDAFQKGENSVAWVLIRFMAVLVPAVFLVSGVARGSWLESFAFALSVAVGLTPEMLPLVINACLARGSLSMSRKRAIVKNIDAMQVLGSMDVLCIDKTGTLTQESILLEYYLDILGNESPEALELAYLNSFHHSGLSNPIDSAILACRTMPDRGGRLAELAKLCRKTDEIPFDYERKFVSTLVRTSENSHLLIVKGDIRRVFSRCRFAEYRGEAIPIGENEEGSVSAIVDEMLEEGMKVIAVAKKELGAQETLSPADENDMTLVGYLVFFDAPKRSAAQSVEDLKRLRVTPKVMTGDNSQTALSICRRVGLPAAALLTGAQIGGLSDEELRAAVKVTDIFAELTPGQKVSLLSALRDNGHTTGFLGDGMNDIPALNEADVGISVDTAVDAAKEAADVILLEKELNILGQGIMEGRRTFVNMLKYIKITASSNFGNILSVVCASVALPFFPMTAIQLLLLNLLYDTLCIVLPWDSVDAEDTEAPREWSGKTLSGFMLSFGPISSIFDIMTFLFLYFILCPRLCGGLLYTQLADPELRLRYAALFQTGWFLESMWTQVLILHMLRTKKIPFLQSRASGPVLLITLLGIVVFTGLTMTPLAHPLGLTRLPLEYFGFLLPVVLLYMLLVSFIKRLYIRRHGELI